MVGETDIRRVTHDDRSRVVLVGGRQRWAGEREQCDMTNVQLNGIDFYFERIGSGPRLLFCNGS
ncbi:MAG: hypothetical protein WBW80_08545, partial [Acidimicrobiales bacterium]